MGAPVQTHLAEHRTGATHDSNAPLATQSGEDPPVRRIPLAVAALLALATAASAAPLTFNIDRPHSQVGFTVRHFFSKVPGQFKDFTGTIVMDKDNPAASSVQVTIQTASISTDNDRRDTHLRSADFFAADSFPTITFKSTKVVPAGKDKVKITGDLTMHGVTRPVTLDVDFLGMGSVGQMGTKAGFEAAATVNRQDFNIRWNKLLDQGGTMLGDDVAITLHIEANQQ
jgi:polyisoprenoid-binding protein YceI